MFSGGIASKSLAGRMCLVEVLARIRHARRMCLAEVLARMSHAGRMCLAEMFSRTKCRFAEARALPHSHRTAKGPFRVDEKDTLC